jgi:hypothetical protein
MNGKRREMGLGGFPSISLEVARKRADEARKLVADGVDPIAEKKAVAKKVEVPTFRACVVDYLKLRAPSFRNEKHLAQWRTTLGLDPIDTKKCGSIGRRMRPTQAHLLHCSHNRSTKLMSAVFCR